MSSAIAYTCSTITAQKNFSLSNTTANIDLWTMTGDIILVELFGVVTTAISSNHTAGLFRATSGAATLDLNLSGVTLSSLGVGTTFYRSGSFGNSLDLLLKTAGTYAEQANRESHSPTIIGPTTGQTTWTLSYRHTTTNTPESGAAFFSLTYAPFTSSATVVAA